MSTERQLELFGYGELALFFALPLLIVVVAGRFRPFRSRVLRFCLAVFIPWLSLQDYHSRFISPLSFRLARASGDTLYDGTGASGFVFLFGFIFPALVAFFALGIEAISRRGRSPSKDALRNNTNVA